MNVSGVRPIRTIITTNTEESEDRATTPKKEAREPNRRRVLVWLSFFLFEIPYRDCYPSVRLCGNKTGDPRKTQQPPGSTDPYPIYQSQASQHHMLSARCRGRHRDTTTTTGPAPPSSLPPWSCAPRWLLLPLQPPRLVLVPAGLLLLAQLEVLGALDDQLPVGPRSLWGVYGLGELESMSPRCIRSALF